MLPLTGTTARPPADPMLLFGDSLKEVVMRKALNGDDSTRELFADLQVSLEAPDLAHAAEQAVLQGLQNTSIRLSLATAIPARGQAAIDLTQLYHALRIMSVPASEFADEVHNRYLVGWANELQKGTSAATPHLRVVTSP